MDTASMDSASYRQVEQLRDIYCGRATYGCDAEWVSNMDATFRELCDRMGLDFQPQETVGAGTFPAP